MTRICRSTRSLEQYLRLPLRNIFLLSELQSRISPKIMLNDNERTLIEMFLAYDPDESEPLTAFKRALLKYPRVLDEFRTTLSKLQAMSLVLLEKWIEIQRGPDRASRDAVSREIQSVIRDRHPNALTYHGAMAELYVEELTYREGETKDFSLDDRLHYARRKAFQYAASQQIVSPYFRYVQALFREDPYVPEDHYIDYGATNGMKSCSWLKRTQGYPYYLWDISAKETKMVSSIIEQTGEYPKYLAISHTWGRWIIADEPALQLPGVPWRIPQNTKFRVGDLPEMLEELDGLEDYVWLDLLTIPQVDSESPRSLVELQKQEIARQATIFENAEKTIVWFNEVESWKGMERCISWLCIKYLQLYAVVNDPDEVLKDLDQSPTFWEDSEVELVSCSRCDEGVYAREANPWFTSLWTLQEVCLCPDMVICNREFDPLTLPSCPDYALTMSDITTLLQTARPYDLDSMPSGIVDLLWLTDSTSMTYIDDLSRTEILILGNKRHCTSRRAEAIMSALGITEWYDLYRDAPLVLNQYPLEFLNELRQRVGSPSFFGVSVYGTDLGDVLYNFCEKGSDQQVIGTLLPTAPGAQALNFERFALLEGHKTVESWEIQRSGAVRITEAVIMASSSDTTVTDDQCRLPDVLSGITPGMLVGPRQQNLEEWLRAFKPEMPNYAVVTAYYPTRGGHGILLKELRKNVLIKVGFFNLAVREFLKYPSVKVDWLVL